MQLPTTPGQRHAPPSTQQDGKGDCASGPSWPPSQGSASSTSSVHFAGRQASVGTPDLLVTTRKRKREEEDEVPAGGESAGAIAIASEGQGLPRASLPARPEPFSLEALARDQKHWSADIEVVQREFKSLLGNHFAGPLVYVSRQLTVLVQGLLARLTPAQAEFAGLRIGQDLEGQFTSSCRGELLFGIARGYVQWFKGASRAQEAAGDAVLAGLLQGLARTPAGQGPDPELPLASEFLEHVQALPAPEPDDDKGCPSGWVSAARKAEERDKVHTIVGDEDLVKRLAAVACRVEGGTRITEAALATIVRAVMRRPDTPEAGGADDHRIRLDALDIGQLLDAILAAIDDGRGSRRTHLPGLVRGLLTLDVDESLSPDEVGLAVGYVVDKCARQLRDAKDALNLVIDTTGPQLRTRGAAALAVGAVYGLSENMDRLLLPTDEDVDLTWMLHIDMDAALIQVGQMVRDRPPVRQDVALRSLLAYRRHADARFRACFEQDRRRAGQESRAFRPADTALRRFDAGMADLIAGSLERAPKARQWDWLARHGRIVDFAGQDIPARVAILERLLPPALRDASPQPGESAARSMERVQRRADLLASMSRALALPAAPLSIIDEPGFDDEERLRLVGLTGYFTTRTREQLRARVAEVLASRASQDLKDGMLEALEADTRVEGVTSIDPFLPASPAGATGLSSSSSSSSTSALR